MQEKLGFLNVMMDILPIGPNEWERAVERHSVTYPGQDINSIRRKYHTLHHRQIPIGDPNCPSDVKLAKRVKYTIGDKADIGDGEEKFDMCTASFNGGSDGMYSEDFPTPPVVTTPPIVMAPTDEVITTSTRTSNLTTPSQTVAVTNHKRTRSPMTKSTNFMQLFQL